MREVQEMLISHGYLNDKADGKYGLKTEAAVLAFQRDHGLDATGIMGEGTYKALKNKGADQEGGSAEPDTAFSFWTDGCASLDELTAFVSECTDKTNPGYLEPADRIAVFDMDGTILCEKAPVYIDYCLTMYRVLDDPSYKATEEEKGRRLLQGSGKAGLDDDLHGR